MTRGYRNRNPGNIRKTNAAWVGLAPKQQQTDPEFLVFAEHKYGIRALAKVLLTYQRRHKLDTIEKIVSRWAPHNENNTIAYAVFVGNKMHYAINDKINLAEGETLFQLVKAIIHYENGGVKYTDKEILEGVNLGRMS